MSSLRPNLNSDYFGNTEMDERSNLRLKNETKITKVRNTMAPSTSNSTQSLGLHMHGSYLRVGKPGSSGLMAPSKTPTLYESKKQSQPFLNSDQQKNLHLYRQNDSSNTSCLKYTTSTKATTSDNNRSRTALQSRLQKVGAGQSQTFEHLSSGIGPAA